MIRLRMADYQIVDAVNVHDFLQLFNVVLKKLRLGSLEQDRLVAGFQNVGVVGGSKLCVHDDVKDAEILVCDAGPVEIVSQFYHMHK